VSEATQPDTLAAVLDRHQISLPEDQAIAIERYCHLLWEWNEKLNLTRHTNYELFVSRDLVDAQQLAKLLNSGERVMDMGSGGGVPGIVVAILRPDVTVELCESIAKKARVLEDIVDRLGLRIPVHALRLENVLENSRRHYDVVMARAVGPLWKMLHVLRPHWSKVGCLLALKGPRWTDERGEARHRGYLRGLALRRVAQYRPPGADWESVILRVNPKDAG
jgi:16S rRNA (guanine527-N7)-methyltransferase